MCEYECVYVYEYKCVCMSMGCMYVYEYECGCVCEYEFGYEGEITHIGREPRFTRFFMPPMSERCTVGVFISYVD